MCDYWKPISHVGMGYLSLLTIAATTDTIGCYKAGHVIKLWANSYTFSYHTPKGEEVTDYTMSLTTYHTPIEAGEAMANFVWALNAIINNEEV